MCGGLIGGTHPRTHGSDRSIHDSARRPGLTPDGQSTPRGWPAGPGVACMHNNTHYRTNARPPATNHLEACDDRAVSYGVDAARSIPTSAATPPNPSFSSRRSPPRCSCRAPTSSARRAAPRGQLSHWLLASSPPGHKIVLVLPPVGHAHCLPPRFCMHYLPTSPSFFLACHVHVAHLQPSRQTTLPIASHWIEFFIHSLEHNASSISGPSSSERAGNKLNSGELQRDAERTSSCQ